MKSTSKKHEGSTLIEIVISMMIIAIISVGVYNSYLLLIRQTKAGQVKQTATLVGKQISEEIKSASEDKVTETSESNFDLTHQIHFNKDQKVKGGYKSTQLHFNEKGNLANDNYRYIAEVNLVPKKPNFDSTPISIKEFSNDQSTDIQSHNIYIIKDVDEKAKVVVEKPDNSSNIEGDTTVEIGIEDPVDSEIIIRLNELEYFRYDVNKEKIQQINIDLKYCTGEVTINVDNKTQIPLNLCILNNNDTKIINTKGILNEYYRSEAGSKIGVLYDVNITIVDDRSDDKTKPIFKTSFVQNINIK